LLTLQRGAGHADDGTHLKTEDSRPVAARQGAAAFPSPDSELPPDAPCLKPAALAARLRGRAGRHRASARSEPDPPASRSDSMMVDLGFNPRPAAPQPAMPHVGSTSRPANRPEERPATPPAKGIFSGW